MLKPGMLADIIIVGGDPSIQISVIRQVKFVMKDGVVYRQEK
jgi:imidazolonepropionase-like amidohydrolase